MQQQGSAAAATTLQQQSSSDGGAAASAVAAAMQQQCSSCSSVTVAATALQQRCSGYCGISGIQTNSTMAALDRTVARSVFPLGRGQLLIMMYIIVCRQGEGGGGRLLHTDSQRATTLLFCTWQWFVVLFQRFNFLQCCLFWCRKPACLQGEMSGGSPDTFKRIHGHPPIASLFQMSRSPFGRFAPGTSGFSWTHHPGDSESVAGSRCAHSAY